MLQMAPGCSEMKPLSPYFFLLVERARSSAENQKLRRLAAV